MFSYHDDDSKDLSSPPLYAVIENTLTENPHAKENLREIVELQANQNIL